MRKTLISAIAALALATTAFAADVQKSYAACTKDGKQVTIVFTIHQEIAGNHDVYGHLSTTFKTMASKLTAEELLHSGGQFWASAPDETDVDGADVLTEPTITGTCSVG